MPKHEGITIKIGEREFVLPKLTYGPIKRLWPKVKELRKRVSKPGDDDDMLDALADLSGVQVALIHAALRRNYPDLTLEEVEEGIEPASIGPTFERLVIASHFEATPPSGTQGEAERRPS